MKNATKYVRGLLVALSLFVTVNLVHLLRPVTCDDCFFPYGAYPSHFSVKEDSKGGGGFAWLGLLGDLLVVLIIGAVIGSAWSRSSERGPT